MWYILGMSHTTKATPWTVQLGDRGRLVLPAPARRELGLQAGSRLTLTIEKPGVLTLTTPKAAAAQCRGLLESSGEGRSLAEELISERREAAARE